ncbi:MAG: hypothetical protein A2047_04320 [Omnitrophica bacterium GWA2_41_15]|nr:MAG: hypothetical protein A2047_04320 [Omnitrophica bacterium GWA2_41_15]
MREFGLFGALTYVGGLISFINIIWVDSLERQILFGGIGLFLFTLSTYIVYFRMKVQLDRDVALIKQVGESTKILADKVGGNCTNEQVVSITQSIWQIHKDLGEKLGSFIESVNNKV